MRARWRLGRRCVLLLAAIVALTGCEVRSELNIEVSDDGTGTVEVAIGLDVEAAARLDSQGELDLTDLEATGWRVVGPALEPDGRRWLRVEHDFGSPSEVGALVDQVVAGQVFRDFSLTRTAAFAESTWAFSGTVDFSAGEEIFADDGVDAALADHGVAADALSIIGDRLGEVIDDQLRFQVAIRLPGEVESNAPTRADNGAVWRPSITDRSVIELRATGTVTRSDRILWRFVAIAAGFVLVLFLAVRLALFVRGRRER